MDTTKQVILQTHTLSKIFGSGPSEVRAVDGVNLSIRRGELVLIMGPSGSGKTTLLSMLGALLRPSAGQILIDAQDMYALNDAALAALRARKIGFVFQAFNLLEALSVEENILFPAQLGAGGARAAKKRMEALLEQLGLEKRRKHLPKTLSGGEKQRVAIARALINRPPIVLADEPTGNLDSHKGQDVLMILHNIARDEGCAVVVVTHDPRAEDVADRILWLEDGALHDRKQEDHAWIHDPVCGMRVDAWTASIKVDHEGKTFVFCSEGCRARFQMQPAEYTINGGSEKG